MRGRSWRSFANITITNGRTALWRTERRRHSRRYKGWKQKKLVHRWGAHSRASSLSLWSARDPHEIRGTGLLTLKNSSSGWYRKMGRVMELQVTFVLDYFSGGTSHRVVAGVTLAGLRYYSN